MFTHRNVNSFISHRTWWFVWLRSASYYNDERSSCRKSQCPRRKISENRKRFNRLPFISILCKRVSIMSRSFQKDSLFRAIWWTSIDDLTNIETRSKSGVTADLEPRGYEPPRSKSASGFGPPSADLDPQQNWVKHHPWRSSRNTWRSSAY